MVSIVDGGVFRGLVLGRRDLGWNAVSPSVRYRAMSRLTQLGETPYSRATSAWVLPSMTTDVMINRALDTLETLAYVSRHALPMS